MDKTKAICEYLRKHHVGKENAIHSRELEKIFLLDGRSIHRKVSALRQDGVAICSDETGYDAFSSKYGIINSRANKSAFNADNSFCLLSSLEILDDDGNFVRKADMFSRRTIKQKVIVTSVDTASEALAVSLAEKAKVDMPFMMELTGKTEQEVFKDLRGVVFLNPMFGFGSGNEEKYLPADEYLSGNVREKLAWAKRSAETGPEEYADNVAALQAVQPADLTAADISVRLGATWLPPEIIEAFMFELFNTPRYCQWNIHVHYSKFTGDWNIEGKAYDRSNVMAYNTYGTDRINGYKIVEQTLNLKDVRIVDYVEDADGRKRPVLNKEETAIAQAKQELIKQAFADWIWKDPERRDQLCRLYNDRFNSVRPREYDGSHLTLVGINPEITLRPHQLNAVARGLYGGNELLGHVVGAGKTFTMVAIAQESKRLGLCQKSMIVVPNHLTEQWAAEYLQLYPAANILVVTAKDFEAKSRKRFCGRIATGDYDAIIIGHSQLEKIPLSVERQQFFLEQQMDEIMEGIAELKANKGDRFSVKQLERTKKQIQIKLDRLNDQRRKDDLVTFEELGIDKLFIDEAHYYKNLAAFTKMRNVGGISQTEAMKSSDLFMKCRYLDELTGGKGVVFATGTPISNTMVELYTMQKYLQYDLLRRNDLLHFDAWASTFGETVTAIELAPEGTGYRAKTRFAKFYNLPELMAMFKETADIQTADMLNLPVPKANYRNDIVKAYLSRRGIDTEIIDDCISMGTLYESKEYHNAVFIGFDNGGTPKYAAMRGTLGQFKGEATGSDKHYSFLLTDDPKAETVHLFESAIDAMSYATLLKITGRDWKQIPLLSLAGVFKTVRKDVVPVALERFLKEHPQVKTMLLHLDNDEIGRGAAAGIQSGLQERYLIEDRPPPSGKDVNDYLLMRLEKLRRKEVQER